jgi:NTP pyrophosphatase (non-canonical NTP hydrolase)
VEEESQPFDPRSQEQSSSAQELGLRQAQQQVDRWIRDYGVRYFAPLTNLAQLMEEVGELARVMNRTYGEQSSKPGEPMGQLEDEFADVLFVLLCLANQTGVDLTTALHANLKKKTQRDRDRHRQNPKLNPNTTDQLPSAKENNSCP